MQDENDILLTAFQGTSAEDLLKDVSKYKVLLLPNDKIKDSEILKAVLEEKQYAYVFSFGQRPNIKNKIHIETTARNGTSTYHTTFDVHSLLLRFQKQGLYAKVSENAGTSFCNRLYWNTLRFLTKTEQKTKMVFLHIPFINNISDIEDFRFRIIKVIENEEW